MPDEAAAPPRPWYQTCERRTQLALGPGAMTVDGKLLGVLGFGFYGPTADFPPVATAIVNNRAEIERMRREVHAAFGEVLMTMDQEAARSKAGDLVVPDAPRSAGGIVLPPGVGS